ncbi:MAG: hypothetical protein KDK03_19385 [Rhodobacteraceae bacterium]|nr:hypothetical protein [Paracoccaceae bacterium]
MNIPNGLKELHSGEELFRQKAFSLVEHDERLALHLAMVEHAMDLCDLLRQFESNGEDLKVVQVFGIRTFNAFGVALKLTCQSRSEMGPLPGVILGHGLGCCVRL